MKTLLLSFALLLLPPCIAAAQSGKSSEPPASPPSASEYTAQHTTQHTAQHMTQRMEILLETGRSEEALALFKAVAKAHDSICSKLFADRRAAEKERSDSGFIFVLAGCILFAAAQGIRISREIKRKSRTVAPRGFSARQEVRNAGQQNKTDFDERKTAGDNELCPESRADRLCNSIRNFILIVCLRIKCLCLDTLTAFYIQEEKK
jgi:hypothetical protein